MTFLSLILSSTRRHRARFALTVSGIAVALLAFCLIRIFIDAWYSGVRASAQDRLVTRNAASLIFPLPLAHIQKMQNLSGVASIGYANWFGGIYKDESIRIAQFAVSDNYLDLYPEFTLSPTERREFEIDRKGAIVGIDIAMRYGMKVGDVIQLQGTIFPGLWEFTLRGIFRPRGEQRTPGSFLFHWDYLNERNKLELKRNPDHVGIFVTKVQPESNPAEVARAIDALFSNSYAETLTESETAFQQSFVSMSSTLLNALRAVSLVVIAIMLLVLTNTMLMSARERYNEFAVLKSIGFTKGHLIALLVGESLVITFAGVALLGLLLAIVLPLLTKVVLASVAALFPGFGLSISALLSAVGAAVTVAVLAGLIPALEVSRLKIQETLRRIG